MSEICFKDSGIEWIGKIPKHWEIWKLKYLARAYTGNSIKDEDKDFYTDPQDAIPYVATKDICRETQKCDYDNGLYIHNDDKNFKRAKKHSTLLCIEGGSAGKKLTYLNTNVCFVNKLCCIEALKGFNGKWLFYFLQSREFLTEFGLRLNGLIGGVSLEKLKRFYIPLPPLQEQEAIAHYLDEKTQAIDELISTHQESIEKLKNYRISLISEVVTQGLDKNVKLKDSGIEWMGKIPATWKTMKVRFLFSLNSGLNITKEDLRDEGIPCISYGEIHSKFPCRVDPQIHSLPCVDEGFINTRPKSLLNKGDFVFADTSEDIEGSGNFSSIQTNSMAFAGYHTIVLKPINKDIYPPYFSFLFDSLQIRTQIRSRVCGVKVYSITKSLLRDVFCIIPPLQEQEAIAHYLDEKTQAIDELISTHQKSIEKLKDYRVSLISEAVTGKKNLQGINNGN